MTRLARRELLFCTSCTSPRNNSTRPPPISQYASVRHVFGETHSSAAPPPSTPLLNSIQHYVGHSNHVYQLRDAFKKPGETTPLPKFIRQMVAEFEPLVGDVVEEHSKKSPKSSATRWMIDSCNEVLNNNPQLEDHVHLLRALLHETVPPSFKAKLADRICRSYTNQAEKSYSVEHIRRLLIAVTQVQSQLRAADLPSPQSLLFIGLLSATRCWSVRALDYYVGEQRRSGVSISSKTFPKLVRNIVHLPKGTTYGYHLLGRNERDKPAMVLSLEPLMSRQTWSCLAPWLRALSSERCLDQLRREWKLWSASTMYTHPYSCGIREIDGHESYDTRAERWRLASTIKWDTKVRGELEFIDAFCKSRGYQEAWNVLGVSEIPLQKLKNSTKFRLLLNVEFAPPNLRNDKLKAALLELYDKKLEQIEEVLRVAWVWDEQTGTGYHVADENSFFKEDVDILYDLSDS